MKTNILVILIAIVLLAVGGIGYVLLQPADVTYERPEPSEPGSVLDEIDDTPTSTIETPEPADDTTVPAPATSQSTIGQSVQGTPIVAHHFGTGTTNLLFVGGLHGGYSYSTSLLAYELIDYLTNNPTAVPSNLRITVVPVMNPDGLQTTVGVTGRFNAATVRATEAQRVAGRFNANDVDLNRNFDCEWQTTGVWRTESVSGGSAPTSEPEAAALATLVRALDPAAAIVWFGAEGRVYPSACGGSPSRASVELATLYGTAADYDTAAQFDAYPVTGDFVNWLAKEGVPAISVLLTSHTDPEWARNQRGSLAIINRFAE